MKSKCVNLDLIFDSGGKPLLDLLEYCVRTVRLEPLFVFLVREYRLHPSASKALVLHDYFCAPEATARVLTWKTFRPGSSQLTMTINGLRTVMSNTSITSAVSPENITHAPLPPRQLFDPLVADLTAQQRGALWKVRRAYDPSRTTLENLPGGRMTAGQRQFVERVWQPTVRPKLVAAGFWRVATVA